MIVLERSLSRIHDGIDIVVTPDGRPVAMAHSNNGSSDLDAWIALFGQVASALGAEVSAEDLSTNASFRRPSGPIRMPAGSSRSTTSRAST